MSSYFLVAVNPLSPVFDSVLSTFVTTFLSFTDDSNRGAARRMRLLALEGWLKPNASPGSLSIAVVRRRQR